MRRNFFLLASSFFLLACGQDQTDVSTPARTAANAQSAESLSSQDTSRSGRETYEIGCGTCHDTGVNGAPVTRNPADWQDRSPLWQAVLMEHADAGYLAMPAKGGHGELSDEDVDTAVLYMLGITFPDRPAE